LKKEKEKRKCKKSYQPPMESNKVEDNANIPWTLEYWRIWLGKRNGEKYKCFSRIDALNCFENLSLKFPPNVKWIEWTSFALLSKQNASKNKSKKNATRDEINMMIINACSTVGTGTRLIVMSTWIENT